MKEIKAIIQPFKLDAVLNALHHVGGLPSVVTAEAQQVDIGLDMYQPTRMIKIELMVPDIQAPQVVRVIAEAAHTGNPGDGRIFVIPIEESIVIRTGQRGEDAR